MSAEHELCPERPVGVWLAAILLLVSGAVALLFQVVWIRELRLVFGATTASSAAVLAIFMGGLGLGNALLGRRMDAAVRPLRTYGLLELGIALSAAVSPWLVDAARQLYVSLGGQSLLGTGAATGLRLLTTTLILALPTFLMGGTLPAAATAVSVASDVRRRGVALVYGLNTLGAVAGAGLANFVLLEQFGCRLVLWSACLVNVLLAVTALAVSRQLCRASGGSPVPLSRQPAPSGAIGQPAGSLGMVCLAAAVVGFVFFLMEIVWYRMLGPLLGGTTYTFGLILCVALLGIGSGGALYTWAARWLRPTASLLTLTCVLEALLIVIPFWAGDQVALWVLEQQQAPVVSFADQVGRWFQVAAFVILPAAVVAGFQFPLLIALAGSGREAVGKHVGLTFASNTAGAISGSLAGGFLLLPMLTAPGVWRLVVWLLVALGGVLVLRGTPRKRWATGLAGLLGILAVAGSLAEGPTAVWRHSGIGAGRAQLPGTGRNARKEFAHERIRQCVWEAEGIESSVAITATESWSFIVSGKSDGNACSDAGTQIGLGLLGPLLHGSAERGLVIGLGTGQSAGWLAGASRLQSVDVVELEPSVLRMARLCRPMNREVLENPQVRVHYNDAREFLLTSHRQYDVIVSEPSNPYRAGIANLYTREFYRAAAARLDRRGLFLQWLQGYEVDDQTVKTVLQTLRSVFPRVQVWRTKARDMVLVCGNSEAALRYDRQAIEQQLRDPVIGTGMRLAWRVDDVAGVLAHYVCDSRTVDSLLDSSIPLNTDDRNLLEYAFAKTVGRVTRFSVQDLQDSAWKAGDLAPFPLEAGDAERIEQRRLAMQLHLGGEVLVAEGLTASGRIRARAYNLYLAGRYAEAAGQFQRISVDTTCAIESLAYAHTLVEAGRPLPPGLLDAIAGRNATEAAAVRAIQAAGQGRTAEAARATREVFQSLKADPWGAVEVLDAVVRLAATLAEADPAAAAEIHGLLVEPFAMCRLEEKRLVLRYIVAETLDRKAMLDALESLEPTVPWKGWFLENRARVYTEGNHPLSAAARRDLRRYRAWAARDGR